MLISFQNLSLGMLISVMLIKKRVCETSLNDDTEVPENILKGYHFFSCDHSSGEKKGGVGIFYKETLPLKIRTDLSFDECIVCELKFGHKTIFFAVLYRNPINRMITRLPIHDIVEII